MWITGIILVLGEYLAVEEWEAVVYFLAPGIYTVFTRHYRHGAILGFPRITPWRCLADVWYNATGAIV
jgi:hypothetical protein